MTTSDLTGVGSTDKYPKVGIPGAGVHAAADDVSIATAQLLHNLNLLPTRSELAEASGKKLADTPDGIAVVEAGLTKGSKYWTAVIGASSTALTAGAATLWKDAIGPDNQPFAILGLAVVLAAGSLAIAYILGSDVRGRAAAMTATIEVRGRVAQTMVEQARRAYEPPAPTSTGPTPFPLPAIRNVTLLEGPDTAGWMVISGREGADGTEYLLIRGTTSAWHPASQVQFP